jgi:hypothetical protein
MHGRDGARGTSCGLELSPLRLTSIAPAMRRLISCYRIPATFPCSNFSSLWDIR